MLTYICILADTKRRVLGGHADRDVRGLQRLAEGRHVPAAQRAQLLVVVRG